MWWHQPSPPPLHLSSTDGNIYFSWYTYRLYKENSDHCCVSTCKFFQRRLFFFLSFPVCIIWLPCGPPFFFIKKNWFHFSFAQRSCLLSCSLLKRNTSRKKGIKGSTVILYPVPFCSYSLSLILPLHIYIQICYNGHLVIWMCVNVTDSLIDSFLQW